MNGIQDQFLTQMGMSMSVAAIDTPFDCHVGITFQNEPRPNVPTISYSCSSRSDTTVLIHSHTHRTHHKQNTPQTITLQTNHTHTNTAQTRDTNNRHIKTRPKTRQQTRQPNNARNPNTTPTKNAKQNTTQTTHRHGTSS